MIWLSLVALDRPSWTRVSAGTRRSLACSLIRLLAVLAPPGRYPLTGGQAGSGSLRLMIPLVAGQSASAASVISIVMPVAAAVHTIHNTSTRTN